VLNDLLKSLSDPPFLVCFVTQGPFERSHGKELKLTLGSLELRQVSKERRKGNYHVETLVVTVLAFIETAIGFRARSEKKSHVIFGVRIQTGFRVTTGFV
jgi:hypothetical protein